jgi:hypothetical protein
MTASFDVTRTGNPAGSDSSGHEPDPDVLPIGQGVPELDPLSALGMLAEQIAERTIARTTTVEIPQTQWRLVCALDYPLETYKRWQLASVPRAMRRSSKLAPIDIDQFRLAVLTLTNTCHAFEYRNGAGEWVPLVNGDGEPLTLATPQLFAMLSDRLGQPIGDATTLLRKLFGRESAIVKAADHVNTEAGWGLEEPGESDPLDPMD